MNRLFLLLAAAPFVVACNSRPDKTGQTDSLTTDSTTTGSLDLPAPDTNATKNNFSKVIGWPAGKTPVAPAGFSVTAFATNMKSPRSIYIAPNGDILIALSNSERDAKDKIANAVSGKAKSEVGGESENTVLLFRDTNNDGKFEIRSTFLSGLNQPYGMLIIGNSFYVANTDGVFQYPYKAGETKITGKGKKIVSLPAGGYNNHWTRNLIAKADNSKIYISVGSGSNVADHGMENELRRADILEVNPDGTGEKIYASGLRNPVGMDWQPDSKMLWAAVNERDGLGDNLVPDYITSVKPGAFYGWPYSYYGQHEDPRMKGQGSDLVKSAVVPDVPVGSHTASLGLAFYTGSKFPESYQKGAFIGQHGSWNRSELVGYKVAFVPFKDGKPSGKLQDFLTGFIADEKKSEVYGRPVDVAVANDGSLLVADDVSSTIWRVAAN
ncbi:PQQ-dependent sugar dehydrogenase [Pedobacter hartonius]|uniref:Glucose/arabinose dehydrogenase, beta-propeller fold n=1 Tax=Pedobacter hartonius TaxID=425514 RepID=A0A1H3XDU4_9SPHI|nr:sorbosone dehydrogenase family protein [Pedobacter hartonius]SDZ97121.1 Glucose/arabinose dehydrogenase, beta-propeller fold [Pedobacter hartonius]